jgi:AbrB family looped-hinge helix DNA binding protein
MSTTTVTRNYQITLPKDIRELEEIKIGDRISVVSKENVIELRKFSKERIMSCFGAWKKNKESSVTTVREIRKEAEERLKRMHL